MDYPTFIVLHPEFAETDMAQVNAEITAVALMVDPCVWGTLADTGVRYLTAHRLALSPFGQAARLVKKDGSTTYWQHYADVRTLVTVGAGRVA